MLILSSCLYSKQRCSVPSPFPYYLFIHHSSVVSLSSSGWSPLSFAFLCFLAFSFLLPLLKLPESSSPSVPPLNDQTALVCHHSALSRGILIIAQKQVLFAGLDLRALAGHVLCSDPQKLVSPADSAFTLFVDRDDVDGELPPLAGFFRLQDVDLNGCRITEKNKKNIFSLLTQIGDKVFSEVSCHVL